MFPSGLETVALKCDLPINYSGVLTVDSIEQAIMSARYQDPATKGGSLIRAGNGQLDKDEKASGTPQDVTPEMTNRTPKRKSKSCQRQGQTINMV